MLMTHIFCFIDRTFSRITHLTNVWFLSKKIGQQREGEERKRKKKTRKKRDVSPMVITKPRSPAEQTESWHEWEEPEYEAEDRGNKSDLDWEDQGELDFERQLALEKRRQDLQRQLAQMDEEEAAQEKTEIDVRDVKKDREEQRSVPVVHSRLHPESASSSPPDEPSSASSQSTPKKKKKKVDPDAKKGKSPFSKERKRKLPRAVPDLLEPKAREVSETSLMKVKSKKLHLPPQDDEEIHFSEPRTADRDSKKILKSHEKSKEGRGESHDQYRSPLPPSEEVMRRDDAREMKERTAHGFDDSRDRADRTRRRVSPSEEHDIHSHRDHGEERTRRSREGPGDIPRRALREGADESHKHRKDKDEGLRKQERLSSPAEVRRKEDHEEVRHGEEIQPEGRGRRRHMEGGSRLSGPRTPSPEHSPTRGPRTPPPDAPEDRHYHAQDSRKPHTPPKTTRHGPRTPPGEPSFEGERHPRDEGRSRGGQSPPRHQRGPRTPPDSERFLSPTLRDSDRPRRTKDESEEFREEHVTFDREGAHHKKGREGGERRGEVHKVRPGGVEDFPRDRARGEVDLEYQRRRTREADEHQKTRTHDGRIREEPRDVERRHDEREDAHQRARPRAEPRDDDHQRRRDERDDEFSRGRGREEREGEHGRGRVRDVPRRQFEGNSDRRWDGRERDNRDIPQLDRCVTFTRLVFYGAFNFQQD